MAGSRPAPQDIADGLPKVWMRIDIDGEPVGTMKILLRADVAPRTCENFRGLCTGEYGRGQRTGKQLTMKGTSVFRILPGQLAVAGDLEVSAVGDLSFARGMWRTFQVFVRFRPLPP